MERRRSGGSLNGPTETVSVNVTNACNTTRRARAAGQSALDVSDVSTTSATSVPSSAAGAAFEQEMQRRILAMESKLKDVDVLIKEQMPQSQAAEVPPIQQMQQELDEMQRYRETLQAKADGLEQLLQKERKQHEAALEEYSASMAKSIESMNHNIDQSVAQSNSLMKARMVEAESLVTKLVGQLNSTFQKPVHMEAGTPPGDLVQSMTQLLEEHQQLMQRQQHLLAVRNDGGLVTMPAIPIWQGYAVYPADGARSPGRTSPALPESSPHSAPNRSPQSSPSLKCLNMSPSRSPKSPRSSPKSPMSPRALSPRVVPPQGDEEELRTTGMRFMAEGRPVYDT